MAQRDDEFFGADQRVHDAMASLEEERTRVSESYRARNEQRTTIHAKDRSFSMTFTGRGDLVDLTFQGTKYRGAAPTELAHQIVETIERGRLQALEAMAASMTSPALAGVDLVGIATGKADPSKVVDALLKPLLSGVPGRGSPGVGGRG